MNNEPKIAITEIKSSNEIPKKIAVLRSMSGIRNKEEAANWARKNGIKSVWWMKKHERVFGYTS